MAVRVSVGSVNATLQALHQLPAQVLERAAAAALEQAGGVLGRECEATLSHTDHSLAQLAAGGPGFPPHPYARRHGKIRIHPEQPHIVHKQSGELLRDGFHHGLAGSGDRYHVWLDPAAVHHARWVMEGTRTMLGRDSLRATAGDARVQRLVMRAMVRQFGLIFRTQSMVRFNPRALFNALILR